MAPRDLSLNREIADQRYYHFVVFRGADDITLKDYWTALGDAFHPKLDASSLGKFPIQHRRLRLSNAYAGGRVAEALRDTSSSIEPAFIYDLFASKLNLQGSSFWAFGFPFFNLGRFVTKELPSLQNLFGNGTFQKSNVPLLIRHFEKEENKHFTEIAGKLISFQTVIKNDKFGTAVRIGGEEPLKTDIYTKYVRNEINEGVFQFDRCVLSCHPKTAESERAGSAHADKSSSRIHVDVHGNFSVYARIGGLNLYHFPYLVAQLATIGCLESAYGIPFDRVPEEFQLS